MCDKIYKLNDIKEKLPLKEMEAGTKIASEKKMKKLKKALDKQESM